MFVKISRLFDVEERRKLLPIILEEDRIIEAINANMCVIICGETGCGKTTQVPQFLYQNGYGSLQAEDFKKGMIGITEPRRIAAILMASTLAKELNDEEIVGYQVRFENTTTEKTRIKLMTDGILMKEIEQDFMLSKYSAIILDEAHQRSLHTDILIGLLSRIVPLRHKRGTPLKLIIMSATLCLDDFLKNKKLFQTKPPLINIESRQHTVSLHFSRETPENYIESAFKKVVKIHMNNPTGHILVFVSCQQEVIDLTRILNERFKKRNNKRRKLIDGTEEIIEISDKINENSQKESALVLPLYAMLQKDKQIKVFKEYGTGLRKIIVSTNVAETSITIPGVKYIVDTGKEKQKIYDRITGAQKYIITWCSKASANQRTGRAGRTSAGHCYRLYSTAVFQYDFPDFTEPDILKQSIQGVVLQMKCMNLGNVKNFPFPTQPHIDDINKAEEILCMLGALEPVNSNNGIINRPTQLGRQINSISLLPRYSKMVIESVSHNVAQHIIAIASTLSIRDLMTENLNLDKNESGVKNSIKIQHRLWGGKGVQRKLGDFIVLLNCVGAAVNSNDLYEFCLKYGVRKKALDEVFKLFNLIKNQVSKITEVDIPEISELIRPTNKQIETIRKILTVCFKDQIARKIDRSTVPGFTGKAIYAVQNIDRPAIIHPNSILYNSEPEIIIFHELREGKQLEMMGVCEVDEGWVVKS